MSHLQGFILSDAALYSFECQDVYPDILSFVSAIPNHLKPLFLIPVQFETANDKRIAKKIATDYVPTGDTNEADLFGYKTFVTPDDEVIVPNQESGSIFEMDTGYGKTHQDDGLDENVQVPSDTSYLSDIDTTQYWTYPYRTEEESVRHSAIRNDFPILYGALVDVPHIFRVNRYALKPEELVNKTPEKIKKNSRSCDIELVSYDKKSRIYTFSVDCGNGAKKVQATLSTLDEVNISCTCPFWRWNGPEHNAVVNRYMQGPPFGSASPPDVRDPNREYALCKHAYAVLRRIDGFVEKVIEDNWDLEDEEVLEKVDENWSDVEDPAVIDLDDDEQDLEDIDVEWDDESVGEFGLLPGEYDVDISDLEESSKSSEVEEEAQKETETGDEEPEEQEEEEEEEELEEEEPEEEEPEPKASKERSEEESAEDEEEYDIPVFFEDEDGEEYPFPKK